MGTIDEPALLEIAQAICDGRPVAWESLGAGQGALRSRLKHLRLLESVAVAHRTPDLHDTPTLPGAEDEPGPPQAGDRTTDAPSGEITQWGPLQILGKLGHGGFGEVYRAFDPALAREVALKLRRIDGSHAAHGSGRFIEEARKLARVRHPNVLAVHGADEHGGRVGLWTDLLEGKTLEQCLAEQGPFSADEAALAGIEICRALAAVHNAGLVHRDVKTSNVMREVGGRIVLMDFGSVSEYSDAARQSSGTPLSMAPEVVAKGEAPNRQSDIYSLGVLLYRLSCGRFPVEAASLADLLDKHRRGESVPLRDRRSDLPTVFVQVVERALSPDPSRRYASVGQMESALIAAVAAVRPAPEASRWSRRSRLAAAAGLAALVIGLALGLAFVAARWTGDEFSVEASLYRAVAGAEVRLQSGSHVKPGDALFLEVRGSRALHLYVLNEDQDGQVFVLFPAGLDQGNPLPARALHRLPGARHGAQEYWQITSAGGRETIVMVASREPLGDLEREIANFPRAEPGRPVDSRPLSPIATNRVVRGIGGLLDRPSPDPSGRVTHLSELARVLPEGAETTRGVWIRRIELENPGS